MTSSRTSRSELPSDGTTALDEAVPVKRKRSPAGSSRTKGRPSVAADRVGRDMIIEKTCELLRSHPPSEVTRVLAARASDVHPSLIHYYFKTRSSLMIAAAGRLTLEFRRAIDKRNAVVHGSPTERLRARVEILVDLELSYPYFHRLLVEEVLTSDDPAAQALTRDLASRGMTRYQAIIDDGVAVGELRDVDGGWLFTSVISLCQFFDKAKTLYRTLAHPSVSDAELEASYRRFLIDLVMNAVTLPPQPKPKAAGAKAAPKRARRITSVTG